MLQKYFNVAFAPLKNTYQNLIVKQSKLYH